jgi:hypothetical protein
VLQFPDVSSQPLTLIASRRAESEILNSSTNFRLPVALGPCRSRPDVPVLSSEIPLRNQDQQLSLWLGVQGAGILADVWLLGLIPNLSLW